MAYEDDKLAVQALIDDMKGNTVAPYPTKVELDAFWDKLSTLTDAMDARVQALESPY